MARPIIPSLFAKANEMERQMDQWDLVIKVKHGDTLRRIGAHVHGRLMDLNMSKLRYKIISLFKISRDDELILSYTDEDGDIVTLDDDDELRDAVIGQRLNPIRINVQLKSTDSSDARPERSSPTSSVNAPRHVVIPTVVEQENTTAKWLLGVVSSISGNAQNTLSSSPAFAQKVDVVMKCEPFRSTTESLSEDVKKAAEHLSNLGLSNAGQTSGPSCESSGVHRGTSTHQRDLNVSEEPKNSNGPILEDIGLPSDIEFPNENRSGNVVVQGAGVMSHSVDRNVDATKKGEASLYPSDDLRASICTANNFPEHGHEEDYNTYSEVYNIPPTNQALHCSRNVWTPAQIIPINVYGSAATMEEMKADLSSPSQTVFKSHAKVPSSGPFGATAYANYLSTCTPWGFHRGGRCNRCGMQPIVGPRFKANGEEEYHLCNICFTQVGNAADYTRIDDAHPSGSSMLQPAFNVSLDHTLVDEPEEMGFKQNELGKDIHWYNEYGLGGYAERDPLLQSSRKWDSMAWSQTVFDGTVMPPSTHFTKIWRFRNIGNVSWPVGTHLLWDGGYQFGNRVSARLEIPQIGVPFDKELDVAVDFTAPSMPGRYASYWRMAAPNGQKFGQRVLVLIQVQVDYSTPNSAAGTSLVAQMRDESRLYKHRLHHG